MGYVSNVYEARQFIRFFGSRILDKIRIEGLPVTEHLLDVDLHTEEVHYYVRLSEAGPASYRDAASSSTVLARIERERPLFSPEWDYDDVVAAFAELFDITVDEAEAQLLEAGFIESKDDDEEDDEEDGGGL
jgi:hypothetical protein